MSETPFRLAVVGHGLIADATVATPATLTAVERVSLSDLTSCDGAWQALVSASDCGDVPEHDAAYEASQALGNPWLPIHCEAETVVIGPVTMPPRPGCPRCLALRRSRAAGSPAGRAAAGRADAAEPTPAGPTLLTTSSAGLIAALAVGEIVSPNTESDAATCSALFVDLKTLRVERHDFLPEPLCPRCGSLPDDSRDDAVITLQPRPKPTPTTYRLRAMRQERDSLLKAYCDQEAGLIPTIIRSDKANLPVSEAAITLRVPEAEVAGAGRAWDRNGSDVTAVLEALERYAGANPVGKRTTVRSAYADIRDQALDPASLGSHEDEFYERGPYQRFTEDAVYNWVWGFSLTSSRPVLVPESYAYFWTHNRPDPRFIYEVTNGAALGSCLEEAILYGVLEVAERDALLLTWHSRIPARAIDLTACDDRAAAITATAITQATGYHVAVYDTTTETGIPSVWALATHPRLAEGRLRSGSGELAMFSAAGSHLSPHRAVLSALCELGPQLADAIERFPAREADARRYLTHPEEVQTIFDHALAFGDPGASRRLDFLTDQRGEPTPMAGVGRCEGFANDDLRDDLLEVVDRFRAADMEVIVVDQTALEHRQRGLVCAKAIIPGTVPLTYGHHRRRLRGLPRLLTVPRLLGHTDGPAAASELNVLPHPFAA